MIAKAGFDDLNGARPLKRSIQDIIENFISIQILMKKIEKGKKGDVINIR